MNNNKVFHEICYEGFWDLSEMMNITGNITMECLYCLRPDFGFLNFVN